jgi:hypothetical protein
LFLNCFKFDSNLILSSSSYPGFLNPPLPSLAFTPYLSELWLPWKRQRYLGVPSGLKVLTKNPFAPHLTGGLVLLLLAMQKIFLL